MHKGELFDNMCVHGPHDLVLEIFLCGVYQSFGGKNARDLANFVLVEDNISIVLDKAALSKCTIERAEGVLMKRG